jgi:hypothetical protein
MLGKELKSVNLTYFEVSGNFLDDRPKTKVTK